LKLVLNVDASEDESQIRLPCWLITDRTLLIVWITDPTFFNLLTLDHGSGSIGPKCCGVVPQEKNCWVLNI
jgi:hypothetical protein